MNVSVGPATIVGYLLSALGTAGTALSLNSGDPTQAKWMAILAIVSGVATNLGRQLQAGKTPVEAIEDVLDPALGITASEASAPGSVPADGTQSANLPRATA